MFYSFSYHEVCDLALKAQRRVIYCSPNIFHEIAHILAEKRKEILDVRVIITMEEKQYRNGFGDIASIEILKKAGIPIYDNPNSNVSFIIVDDYGYYIFPQSERFKDNEKSLNAVEIDSVSIVKMVAFFFPPNTDEAVAELRNELSGAIEQQKTQQAETANSIIVSDGADSIKILEEEIYNEIKESLIINPPIAFNIVRLHDVYSSKIRYVDLEFVGSNFTAMKIELPKNTLPIKNKDFNELLETKIHLFNKVNESIEVLRIKALGKKERQLRKTYLIHLPQYKKNVIRKIQEKEFLNEVETLRIDVETAGKKLSSYIEGEVEQTKELIRSELFNYYKNNQTKKNSKQSEVEYEAELKNDVEVLIDQIVFPEAKNIIGKLTLKYFFSDVTIENLKDPEFRTLLVKQGLIDAAESENIVTEFNAAEIKKIK